MSIKDAENDTNIHGPFESIDDLMESLVLKPKYNSQFNKDYKVAIKRRCKEKIMLIARMIRMF